MPITFDELPSAHAQPRAGESEPRRGRERLLHLAEHLPARDRWLLEQVYRHGIPLATLVQADFQSHAQNDAQTDAQASAPPDARTRRKRQRQLSRRLTGIVRRLRDPAFVLSATRPEVLPAHTRRTARHVFIHGRSLRGTAQRLGLSLHRVRAHVQTVRELARIL